MTNLSDLYEDCFFILVSFFTIAAKKWEKTTLRNDSELRGPCRLTPALQSHYYHQRKVQKLYNINLRKMRKESDNKKTSFLNLISE